MQSLRLLLLCIAASSFCFGCQLEHPTDTPKLILGTWDCVDYADSVDHVRNGRPPVFISNLYEKGYQLKRNGTMWTRNYWDDDDLATDKRVECQWLLSEDHEEIQFIFPDDVIETYEIIELNRKLLVLKGKSGLWAETQSTYYFDKQ